MSRGADSLYFVLLTVLACAAFGYVFSHPGLQDPRIDFAREECLRQPGVPYYDFLPHALNRVLCGINTVFQAAKLSKPCSLLMPQFGAAIYVTAGLFAYESFAKTGFLARRGIPFLMLGQMIPIGIIAPIFLAILRWSPSEASSTPSSRSARSGIPLRPRTEEIWAVVLAVLVGYIGPMTLSREGFYDYHVLSIWQAYPVYMGVVATLLPPILRPFVANTSPKIPIAIFALIGIAISIHNHFTLLRSGEDFRDVVMLFTQPPGFATDIHRLFLVDFVFSALATASYLILSFTNSTAEEKLGYGFVILAGTQMVGIGGAMAFVFALREMWDVERKPAVVPVAGSKDKKDK